MAGDALVIRAWWVVTILGGEDVAQNFGGIRIFAGESGASSYPALDEVGVSRWYAPIKDVDVPERAEDQEQEDGGEPL